MKEAKAISLAPAMHREKAVITIVFDYNRELAERVKALPGAQWSQTMKCWYVPDTEAYRRRFGLEVKTASEAVVQKLCAENEAALQAFVRELQLKGYSRSTMITYRNEFVQLLQTLG